MDKKSIAARFRTLDFTNDRALNSVVFYGCVRNPLRMHSYYVMDLLHAKCHVIDVSASYTLRNFYRRLQAVKNNNYIEYRRFATLRTLFQDGTYGLKQFSLLVGSLLPHHVTHIGNQRFWIGTAGSHNALICDLGEKAVTSVVPTSENDLLGPQVAYDKESNSIDFLTYDLRGHIRMGSVEPGLKNHFSVKRYHQDTGQIETLWQDDINCFLVDGFRVTADRRYAIFSDLRFALNDEHQFEPSSIYIVDLVKGKHWEIPDLKSSAHVEIDPDDPHVIYVSEHQIGIIIKDKVTESDKTKNKDLTWFATLGFVTKEVGAFVGVAAIHKYRITDTGPVRIATFSDGKDFVRATWHFVFKNKGKKYLGSISSPYIVIIDAETMTLHKKIKTGVMPLYGLQVSEDGEQFYCNSFFDFYIIDFDSGDVKAHYNLRKREKGKVFHVSAHTTRVDGFWEPAPSGG